MFYKALLCFVLILAFPLFLGGLIALTVSDYVRDLYELER